MTFEKVVESVESRIPDTVCAEVARAIRPMKAPNAVSFLFGGRRVEAALDGAGNVEVRRVDKLRVVIAGSQRTLPMGQRAIDEILGGIQWMEARADAY